MDAGALARPRKVDRDLLLVGTVAAAVGLAYVLIAKRHDVNITDEGDAFWYGAVGQLIAKGGGIFRNPFSGAPTAQHGPVTALLAAFGAWVGGQRVLPMRLTMTAVGVATAVVVTLVGRAIGGRRVGLVAGLLAATYPALWVNDGLIMAEGPAALVTAVALLLVLRVRDRPTIGRAIALGAVLGLAALVRSELVLLVLLLGITAFWRRPKLVLPALAATAVIAAPWMAWNLARFDRPTFLTTNDGLTVLGANCPEAYSGGGIGLWHLQCALAVPATGDESDVSATWRAEGLHYLRTHAGRLPVVVAVRIGRTFGVYHPGQLASTGVNEGREPVVSWLALVEGWLLVPLAMVGGVRLARRRRPVAPLLMPIVAVVVMSAAVYGLPRFRTVADVSLVVLAAAAIITPTAPESEPDLEPTTDEEAESVDASSDRGNELRPAAEH